MRPKRAKRGEVVAGEGGVISSHDNPKRVVVAPEVCVCVCVGLCHTFGVEGIMRGGPGVALEGRRP